MDQHETSCYAIESAIKALAINRPSVQELIECATAIEDFIWSAPSREKQRRDNQDKD